MKRLTRKLRSGITFKLFIALAVVMVAFTTIVMTLQTAFFQSYYESRTKRAIERDIERLAEQYRKDGGPYPEPANGDPSARSPLPPAFAEFEKRYYALTSVIRYAPGQVRIVVGGGLQSGAFDIRFERPTAVPLPADGLPSVAFRGLPYMQEQSALLEYARSAFLDDPERFRAAVQEGRTLVYPLTREGEYADTLVAVAAVRTAASVADEWALVMAVASLQPVGEANVILRDFSAAFYGLAVLLIVGLSFWFSRGITRPLRRLGRTAERLANLDFAARTDIVGDDEIGRLGRTMNFLSVNLKQALGELQQANAKLQAEIEHEKKLEAMRRTFVAGVSHELKTPLAVIGGYAEGLRDGIATEERRGQYAAVILEETQRMAGLVKDMLDLSQLEAGRYRLKLEPFDLVRLTADTLAKREPFLAARSLRAELTVDGAAVLALPEAADAGAADGAAADWPERRVTADRFRMEQVLANLLDNAVSHCREGGRIDVRIVREDARLGVYVRNDGDPIPEASLLRVWEHFYRGDAARSRGEPAAASSAHDTAPSPGAGAGLGLAIVRQLLELHGCVYGVRNTDGGVEFRFAIAEAGTVMTGAVREPR